MRSMFAIGVSALTALWASSALAAGSYTLDEVSIVFGKPGEVLFDATGTKKLMKMPEEIRVFATEEDYFKFLETDLNAELVYDGSGRVVDYNLQVTSAGAAYYWDYARDRFMDVRDFKASFIAGPFGFVSINNKLVCVNPAICDPDHFHFQSRIFSSIHGLFQVEASLPTAEHTVGNLTKIERTFRTAIIDPDPAKLLDTDGCEACWNGHCIVVPCMNAPWRWELQVDPFGIYVNGGINRYDPPPKVVQNEVAVTVSDMFVKDGDLDLKCSVVNSKGEIFKPFSDVASDFTSSGECPPELQ